ncbi:ABC transporter permease [Acrocarpospora sp. B8E8]|uniref:ABC transporter permease n=1 Tax=Acrocarpospora sp. B8E8 TaxID=3153572 RepID=UPI00325E22E9
MTAKRRTSTLGLALPPLTVFVLVLAGWYGVTYGILDADRRFLLPPPHQVIVDGYLVADTRADILTAALVSLKVAAIGLSIAFVIGSVLAILMAQARWIERSLYPWAVFLQTIPILAIVPVIGFWFGYELTARVIVCVLISAFPLIINPLQGLLSTDRGLHDLMTLARAGRLTRLIKLQIPSALPQVFVALQTAAGLAIVGAIVGDFFFGRGETGLGLLLSRYSSRLQSAEMIATMFVAAALGILVFWIFGVLGRRIVGRWSDAWGAAERQVSSPSLEGELDHPPAGADRLTHAQAQ